MCFPWETGFLEETIVDFKLLDDENCMMKEVLELALEAEPPKTSAEKCRTSEDGCTHDAHQQRVLAIRDAMDVLSGKWKILLIGVLLFKGKMRFMELLRHLDGIGAKMLSKELQDLEANQLVTRTVLQTKPITVEYEVTPYGRTLEQVVLEILSWGVSHRERIMR